jgi:hypothetical protein
LGSQIYRKIGKWANFAFVARPARYSDRIDSFSSGRESEACL